MTCFRKLLKGRVGALVLVLVLVMVVVLVHKYHLEVQQSLVVPKERDVQKHSQVKADVTLTKQKSTDSAVVTKPYASYDPPLDFSSTKWLQHQHLTKMSLAELDDRVSRIASPDHWITITSSDQAFFDMTMNMYSSMQKIGVKNFLVVAYSPSTCDMYINEGVECLVYFDYDIGQNISDLGSQVYNQKLTLRILLIYDLLYLGYSVHLVDADIVLFKHPNDLRPTDDQPWHLAGIEEGKGVNGGFVFYKQSLETMALLKQMGQQCKNRPRNDQLLLNNILKDKDSYDNLIREVKVVKIPRKHILTSCERWKPPTGIFYVANKDKVFAHLTCMKGLESKTFTFKESGMWSYDRNGQYSNPTAKYVTYQNTYPRQLAWPTVWTVEKLTLTNAMVLSTLLNRTLILPSFMCRNQDNNLTYHCGLHVKAAMRCFLQTFSNVREHMFLYHPDVPQSVKISQTESCSVLTTPSQNKNLANRGAVPNTIDIDQVNIWLRSKKESVLNLQDLHFNVSAESATKYKGLIQKYADGIHEIVDFRRQKLRIPSQHCSP